MALIDQFIELFDVWDVAQPHLSRMVDEDEMRLVVAMRGQSLTPAEVANRLNLTIPEATARLERGYGRCLMNKTTENGTSRYTATSFGHLLDHFAKYEAWDDIPSHARQAINRRFLDESIAGYRPNVERKMQGLAAENCLPNDTVMLLHEIEEMIDAATHIVVQPCDCRRLGQNCSRPVETCIWFDAGALEALDRGHGRRLTHDEAKQLVRWADKKGLMHTADSDWKDRGLHAICNCCACDCYPFRAAQELGSKGVWPKSRYVAIYHPEHCNLCGSCVKRCHFDAFYHDGTQVDIDGRWFENVRLDPDLCWGCGLCANACPAGAISMESNSPKRNDKVG